MREQERKFKELKKEFDALRGELFKGKTFAVVRVRSKKWARYDQLLGFFFPQFRYDGWKNPLEEDKK
jgi:hypothetical protein